MTEYENEYPLVEENVVIPMHVEEDKVEQAFKEERIEAAFEATHSALVPLEASPPPPVEPPQSPPRVATNTTRHQSPPRVPRHQIMASPKTPKTALAVELASSAIEAAKEHIEYEEYYEEYTDKEEDEYTYTEVTDDEYQNGQMKSPPPPSESAV